MGQKVHPHGFRVGIIKDWDSRWYARADKVGDLIIEDYEIREYLKKLLSAAGVPRIEIERDNSRVRILISCARPGVIIGKGGTEIEKLRAEIEKKIGKPVAISIVEIKNIDANAQLVAEGIAQRLEKRVGYRRAMKNAMSRAMRLGIRGIKVMVAGRLGGAEIAKSETYHEGTIPLQTLRADIEYGFAEAATTYGRIGVKVWIYKGEILSQTLRTTPRTMDLSRPQRERRDNRDNRSGGNRDNRSGGANRNDNRSGGYQGGANRTSSGGYQGNRDNNRTGGYQGGQNSGQSRPQSSGYQGNRDNSRPSGNYQGGSRPAPAQQTDRAPAQQADRSPAPNKEGGEG